MYISTYFHLVIIHKQIRVYFLIKTTVVPFPESKYDHYNKASPINIVAPTKY